MNELWFYVWHNLRNAISHKSESKVLNNLIDKKGCDIEVKLIFYYPFLVSINAYDR